MLISCPECELQVSDKALSCPHCGYPMHGEPKKTKKKRHKYRRLPNGFGQITELKGNLREPFRAMITVGKTPEGRPICKLLKPKSYFKTYNDAYEALVEYHRNPYDLDANITVEKLFQKWTTGYFLEITPSTVRGIKAAWKYCEPLYSMSVVDLKAHHIKACIENANIIRDGEVHYASAVTKELIKTIFNKMLAYAVEYDLVQVNVAKNFTLDKKTRKAARTAKQQHIPFTDAEIETLWANINESDIADIVLIQCYTGWRPQELGLLELANIDLKNWTMVGGMKTEAGKDRLVPIHTRIRPLVEARYDAAVAMGSDYLLPCSDGKQMTYHKYAYRFGKMVEELGLSPDHRGHDGRKHFITQAKKYGVDEYAIKYIVGHAITDITERVYTERDASWLASEIEKIV
jgi:integrase